MDSFLKRVGVDPGTGHEMTPHSLADRAGRHIFERELDVALFAQRHGKSRSDLALYFQMITDHIEHQTNPRHVCDQSCTTIPHSFRDYALRYGRVGTRCTRCGCEWGCLDLIRVLAQEIKTQRVQCSYFCEKYQISYREFADALEIVLTDCERSLGIKPRCQCLLS
jgi:hypothetical protein